MRPTFRSGAVAAFAVLLLSGCSDEPETAAETPAETQAATAPAPEPAPEPEAERVAMRAVEASSTTPPSTAPALNAMVPREALAYLRVPNPWGVLGTPKGAAFDRAVGSAPWSEAIGDIREGFGATVLPVIRDETRFLWALLMRHARSPLEAIVLPSPTPDLPFPRVLLSVAVDFADRQAVNDYLARAAASFPPLQISAPLDDQGAGMLIAMGFPVQVRFSAEDSRLDLLATPSPEPGGAGAVLDGLATAPVHPMRAIEAEIDASGQGLFVWLDPRRVLTFLESMGQAGQVAALSAFGAREMEALALGAGASDGLQRFKVVAEMPRVGFRAYVPLVESPTALETAGTPGIVAVLALPAAGDLASLETVMLGAASEEDVQRYLEAKRNFADGLGFTIEEALGAIGQDVAFVSDEAGQYVAVRLRDPSAFDALLERSVERFGLVHEERAIDGRTYHHVVLPALAPMIPEEGDPSTDDGPASEIGQRLGSLPSHAYWTREGDYLLFASVPQVLIDRGYVRERIPLAKWLESEQRLDPGGALALVSARSGGIPALLYALNLQMLVALGDLVERPVDLFAFPSPKELELPEEGAYGIKIASTPSRLSFELGYENNPAEIFFMGGGGGMTALAAVGVVAAVAIPAYHDYTLKAKVAAGVAATGPLRAQLAQFASVQGRFPNEPEVAGLDLSGLASSSHEIELSPGDGRVIVRYAIEPLGDSATIVLAPRVEQGAIVWDCESDIDPKFLPPDCRE